MQGTLSLDILQLVRSDGSSHSPHHVPVPYRSEALVQQPYRFKGNFLSTPLVPTPLQGPRRENTVIPCWEIPFVCTFISIETAGLHNRARIYIFG